MEYIDVLNENGVRTGQIETREQVHLKGLWHRGVIAIIVNNKNQILLQRRSMSRNKFPGLWDLSLAAHVRAGEDSIKTLIREFNEEIGVRLSNNIQARDCKFVSSFQNIHSYHIGKVNYTEKFFYELFIIYKDNKIEDFCFNDGEVDEVKWANYYDVIELVKANKMHPRTEWINIVKKYLCQI